MLRVLKNLMIDSNYYRDALILTRISKTNPVWEWYIKTAPSNELESAEPSQSSPPHRQDAMESLSLSKLTLFDVDETVSCSESSERPNTKDSTGNEDTSNMTNEQQYR